jgi:outer membrane lipoprotein carrier protein
MKPILFTLNTILITLSTVLSRFYRQRLFSFICLSISPCFLFAATEPNENNGLAELVQTLNKIETFFGTFVQYSVDQKGTRIQESRGTLKAQRPGLFYWHTEEPLEQTVYSDGNQVTVYDPDLEQATIQKMNAQTQTTPAILFSGDTAEIGGLFEVEWRAFDSQISQFVLIPKTKDSLFDRLRIRFEGQHLTEMRLTDALGQESTLSFIQSEMNLTFPENTFVPVLPEGTDIIQDLPVVNATRKNSPEGLVAQ